jgi:hypothetical protein
MGPCRALVGGQHVIPGPAGGRRDGRANGAAVTALLAAAPTVLFGLEYVAVYAEWLLPV